MRYKTSCSSRSVPASHLYTPRIFGKYLSWSFSLFYDDCRVPWELVLLNVQLFLISGIPSIFRNFSGNTRIFPLRVALYVTVRAIWAGNTRLLILCFYFHISLVAKDSFAYSFSDLTLVYVFTLLPLLYSALQDVWRGRRGICRPASA